LFATVAEPELGWRITELGLKKDYAQRGTALLVYQYKPIGEFWLQKCCLSWTIWEIFIC